MKATWLQVLGLWLSLGMVGPSFASVILSADSQTVMKGDSTTIDVTISGLGNGTALGGFDLNVGFDQSLLSFSSVTYGDPGLGDELNLEGFGTFTDTVPGTGTTEITELSYDSSVALSSLQAPNFTLASLTFDALSPGVSPIALSVNALPNQNGNPIIAGTVSGMINIQPTSGTPTVPEPGAWLLFCSGLLMLVLRGCRRASNAVDG